MGNAKLVETAADTFWCQVTEGAGNILVTSEQLRTFNPGLNGELSDLGRLAKNVLVLNQAVLQGYRTWIDEGIAQIVGQLRQVMARPCWQDLHQDYLRLLASSVDMVQRGCDARMLAHPQPAADVQEPRKVIPMQRQRAA